MVRLVLPGEGLDVGDGAADAIERGPGEGIDGATGAQILHRHIDRLWNTRDLFALRQLRHGGDLHEGADHPAMQGRDHRIADQVRLKRQPCRYPVGDIELHAEKPGERIGVEQARGGRGHWRAFGGLVMTKAAWAAATGSSGEAS